MDAITPRRAGSVARPLSATNADARALAARFAVLGLFVIAFVAALAAARSLLLPVALAVVLGVILLPVSDALARWRIPRALTALAIVAGLLGIASTALVIAADPLRDWIARAPELGPLVREKLRIFERPLVALNSLRDAMPGAKDGTVRVDVENSLLEPLVAALTPALAQVTLFFVTLFFFLASYDGLRRRTVERWTGRRARLRVLRAITDIERTLAGYFGVITAINIVLGFATAAGAAVIGLPSPIVWGVLAFSLNFVPYLGAAVVLVSMLGVGLLSFDTVAQALLAPAFFLALTTVEGQFVTPGIVGQRLVLNPLMIVLALAFWSWLWGPFGALLAVPLLIIGVLVLRHVEPGAARLPG